jgi:RNA polymerase sigma factor (sigma-70 family)
MAIVLGSRLLEAMARPARTRVAGRSQSGSLDGAAGSCESDELLMGRFRSGDDAAFRRLYDLHRAPLLRFVRRMSPDGSVAEEIVQETWLAVIRSRNRYSPRARFRTYLYSIARRRVQDHWRVVQRKPVPQRLEAEHFDATAANVTEPLAHLTATSREAALARAIDALPREQRETFLLRAEGDLSIEQIALVTGTNRETAKSRLRYAYARLRQVLDAWL